MSKFIQSVSTLAVYLGTGALCHNFFVGPTFVVDNVLSWGWILAWPIALFFKFAVWVFLGLVIICLGFLVYEFYKDHKSKSILYKNHKRKF